LNGEGELEQKTMRKLDYFLLFIHKAYLQCA